MTTKEDKTQSKYVDSLSTESLVEVLHSEITKSVRKIKDYQKQIAAAVNLISKAMLNGGKLYIYGSSTPARLAVVQNLENQSIFSINPELIQSNIFGGDGVLKSINAEPADNENNGRAEIVLSFVKDVDVLIILNNRENIKYSKGALKVAEQKNIPTILIALDESLSEYADVNITIPSKNKKIANICDTYISTVYQTVLNLIFTAVMVKLGKVYENNIIDPNGLRHKEQAVSLVMKYSKTDEETAVDTLEKCKYNPKVAIVMLNKKVDLKQAIVLIKKKKGKINDFVK